MALRAVVFGLRGRIELLAVETSLAERVRQIVIDDLGRLQVLRMQRRMALEALGPAVVGPVLVFHTMPRSVTLAPPSAVTFPPKVALVEVTLLCVAVVTVPVAGSSTLT